MFFNEWVRYFSEILNILFEILYKIPSHALKDAYFIHSMVEIQKLSDSGVNWHITHIWQLDNITVSSQLVYWGLVQERHNSSVLAMEIRLSSTKPLISCFWIIIDHCFYVLKNPDSIIFSKILLCNLFLLQSLYSLRWCHHIGKGIPIIKLRWSSHHLRSMMGNPIPTRCHLLVDRGQRPVSWYHVC